MTSGVESPERLWQDMHEKVKVTVPAADEDQVSRRLLVWLNTCPYLPDGVDLIRFEFLPADVPGMAVSTIQSAYKTRQYVLGGYEAEYQFKLIYRMKPGNSTDQRLKADETLNQIGQWLETSTRPELGTGHNVQNIKLTARSSLFGVYENGDEDHQILCKMTYEVL